MNMNFKTESQNISFSSLPPTDSKTECTLCGELFDHSTQLRRHFKLTHRKQTYKCRRCGQLFDSITDRQTHKNNQHFDNISIAAKDNFIEFVRGTELHGTRNANGYFSCPSSYCSFVTKIPYYWTDHVAKVEHKGENPQKRKKKILTVV